MLIIRGYSYKPGSGELRLTSISWNSVLHFSSDWKESRRANEKSEGMWLWAYYWRKRPGIHLVSEALLRTLRRKKYVGISSYECYTVTSREYAWNPAHWFVYYNCCFCMPTTSKISAIANNLIQNARQSRTHVRKMNKLATLIEVLVQVYESFINNLSCSMFLPSSISKCQWVYIGCRPRFYRSSKMDSGILTCFASLKTFPFF